MQNQMIASTMIALLLSQPMLALAEDPPQADIVIFKSSGKPVPFPGVLYSAEAYAKMKADQEQIIERAENKRRLDLGLQAARMSLATSTTAAALAAERSKNDEISSVKDKRIMQLEDQLVKAEERSQSSLGENILWMLGGVAAVTVGGLVIAAIAGAINNSAQGPSN